MSYNVEVIRHSLAHIMAAAVQKLWPDVKFAGGPAIENGFYYDFDGEHRFADNDFPAIEKEMRELIKSSGKFERREVSLIEAKKIFAAQPYKMEWLNEHDEKGEKLSVYKFRDFSDLCKGPHVESSKDLPRDSFKIRTVAGAYWKGDSKNKMLQRIYVDAFASKDELDAYLKMVEEAALRDNRKLGKDMDLFHFEPDYAPGMVFWHDKGARLYRRMIEFLRARQEVRGYLEIATPEVMDRSLWETSGHWAKYASHNYVGKTQDEKIFCVKPMSCPGGMLVYKHGIKSYKELPLYMAEFGKVHRYEAAGGLSGLMRVRGFTQDDAHIFCTERQLESEVVKLIAFIKDTYEKFGFDEISMKLATRPDSEFRIGNDEVWDRAEGALRHALESNKIPFDVAEGDAAFYGPKIDNYLRDSMGRVWQCGTIQLDMNLPERFDLSYVDENGESVRPIMLHRALIGSIERFMGILLESTGGNLPLWLSPEPVVVVPVSDKFNDYANALVRDLRDIGVHARADLRSETVPHKVRDLSLSKTPIIAVVGEKEIAEKTVALRRLGVEKQEIMKKDDFLKYMIGQIKLPE
ncbi:MAG: threonine--tRNA ligase [Rickettsiales bacterium]|jgi:threonyl-tRNA synthetase|nr:threonine--tRNA ligase [Rickettsiales bacterium]